MGDGHSYVVNECNRLAQLLREQTNYVEAEPLFREVLAYRRKLLGNEHSDTRASLSRLNDVLRKQGKPAEAQ